jgi:hypothetical protein
LALSVVGGPTAWAVIDYGAFEISGNLQTQNIIRHPAIDEVQFIQNRNTVKLRVDWHWLGDGRWIDKFDVPFIKSSKLFLLYRGVYDGFWDIAPGERQVGQSTFDDRIGGPVIGHRAGTCRDSTGALVFPCPRGGQLRGGLYSRFTRSNRSSIKRENVLREAYVDLELQDLPLSFRIGRQQVVWGEADQFRLADIWNPLDITWRFPIGDTFDEFRVPLWLIKGIWQLGAVGPFYNTFLEFVYNPFDFKPGQKISWLPRPWSLPFADPLRDGQVQTFPGIPLLVAPTINLQGTSFRKGDFPRNPEQASEIGARVHAVTPQGVEMTVNYIYGRGKQVGTAPPFGVRLEEVRPRLQEVVGTFGGLPVVNTDVLAKVVHPYNHVFGFTTNYFDNDITSAVLRMEIAYGLGMPYPTTEEDKLLEIMPGITTPVGFTKRDVFAGMVGFDRPTWIRWLNRRTTWFVTSQLFWTHVVGGNTRKLRNFASAKRAPYFAPEASDPVLGRFNATDGFGVWDSGPFTGLVERLQDGSKAPADNIQDWEFLWSLAATSFYRGGSLAPQVVGLFDPRNLWTGLLLQLEYLYTPQFIITWQHRMFVPLDPPTNDPWFVGRFGRRSETALRLTYQF